MTPDLPAVLLILFLSGFVGAVLLELLLRRAVRIGTLAPPRMYMEILINARYRAFGSTHLTCSDNQSGCMR